MSPARTCCIAWLPVRAPSAAHVRLGVEELPQASRAHVGEGVLDVVTFRAGIARRRLVCTGGRCRSQRLGTAGTFQVRAALMGFSGFVLLVESVELRVRAQRQKIGEARLG